MDQNSLSLPKLTHSLSLETTMANPSRGRKTQLLLCLAMANPTMGFDSCMLLGFDRGYCMHGQNPRSKPRSMHESKPIAGSTTVEQRSNCVFLSRFGSATVVSSEWE